MSENTSYETFRNDPERSTFKPGDMVEFRCSIIPLMPPTNQQELEEYLKAKRYSGRVSEVFGDVQMADVLVEEKVWSISLSRLSHTRKGNEAIGQYCTEG